MKNDITSSSSESDYSTKQVKKVLKKVKSKPNDFDSYTELLCQGVFERKLSKQA